MEEQNHVLPKLLSCNNLISLFNHLISTLLWKQSWRKSRRQTKKEGRKGREEWTSIFLKSLRLKDLVYQEEKEYASFRLLPFPHASKQEKMPSLSLVSLPVKLTYTSYKKLRTGKEVFNSFEIRLPSTSNFQIRTYSYTFWIKRS